MTSEILTSSELKAWRLAQNGLLAPLPDIQSAVSQTVGIQAQSPIMAELNIAIRVPQTTKAQIQQAYEKESLVRIWANRWTLHLFTKPDWQLLINARQNVNIPSSYFLGARDLVMTAADIVEKVLKQKGELSRAEYSEILEQELPKAERPDNSDYAVLQVLASKGILYIDPQSSQQKFHLIYGKDFMKTSVSGAIRELIKRYLNGFGPATIEDFVKWSGLKIGEVRPIWTGLRSQVTEIRCAGQDMYSLTPVDHAQLDAWQKVVQDELIIAARYDSTMTGYAEKSWLMEDKVAKLMWSKNGILMAPIISKGEVVGKWSYKISGKKAKFQVDQWGEFNQEQLHNKLVEVANYLEKIPVFG